MTYQVQNRKESQHDERGDAQGPLEAAYACVLAQAIRKIELNGIPEALEQILEDDGKHGTANGRTNGHASKRHSELLLEPMRNGTRSCGKHSAACEL